MRRLHLSFCPPGYCPAAEPSTSAGGAWKRRRGGVQIGTIDALLAQLCLHHDLTMLTSDKDFRDIAGDCALKLWAAPA